MLFDICQMLNEINRGYLPQKGIKGILKHAGTKEQEVLFDRIYRMIPSALSTSSIQAGSGQAGFLKWRRGGGEKGRRGEVIGFAVGGRF